MAGLIALFLQHLQLKRELKQKDEELIIALRKKDKDRLTVNDEHIALTNENARLKTLKDQLFVAVKDRDTKIANLETAFKDLRQKYYEMIQEVETSKSLAMAIKRVAEEGAVAAHSSTIRKRKCQGIIMIAMPPLINKT